MRNVLSGAFNFPIGGLLLWVIAESLGAPLVWVLLALVGLVFAVLLSPAFSHPPTTPHG